MEAPQRPGQFRVRTIAGSPVGRQAPRRCFGGPCAQETPISGTAPGVHQVQGSHTSTLVKVLAICSHTAEAADLRLSDECRQPYLPAGLRTGVLGMSADPTPPQFTRSETGERLTDASQCRRVHVPLRNSRGCTCCQSRSSSRNSPAAMALMGNRDTTAHRFVRVPTPPLYRL